METLTQLCAKRVNREFIRSKNAYIILRELHKWEKDKKALMACENLVDILIRYTIFNYTHFQVNFKIMIILGLKTKLEKTI